MTVLTLFCCGTGSNSFDASRSAREKDQWDDDSPDFPGNTKFDILVRDAHPQDLRVQNMISMIRETRLANMAHYDKSYFEGEIVSSLANQHLGREFADWILIDGPGSGNLQEKILWDTPGEYSDGLGKKLGMGLAENVNHAIAFLKGRVVRPEFVQANGAGAINPHHLQQEIAARARRHTAVTRVNLVGWSRGGVTCFVIANAIAKDAALSNLPVNIFAVDPVPGAKAEMFSWGKTELPANVVNFVGVYARDETSLGFNPVIPKCPNTTTITLLPLPGMHASVAGNSHLDKDSQVNSPFNLEQPGRIARFWAEQSLIAWGTQIRRTANYTELELLTFYRELLLRNAEFLKMRRSSYTVPHAGVRVNRRYYVSNSGWLSNYWTQEQLAADARFAQMSMMITDQEGQIFVNWHHQVICQTLNMY